LAGKTEEKRGHSKGVYGMIILKQVLRKQCGNLWTGGM
jgi:hypothetical protein